jgi:predicted nucleic acid-binding protein
MSIVVVDASALVALLLDRGSMGEWVTDHLRGQVIAAPHLVTFETANIIRRHLSAKIVTLDAARNANRFLRDLQIELWPYEPLADRVWELRTNLTSYDASYVALAELLAAPVITLDKRLASVKRLRCAVPEPPGV